MDSLLSAILSNTYTRSDFYHRFGIVREFGEHFLYQPRDEGEESVLEALERFLTEKEENQRHIQALRAWGEEVWNHLVSGDLRRTLEDVYHAFTSLPVMVLYVPAPLSEQQTEDIGVWVREQSGEQLVLDLRVSPRAAGGCAFSFNGTFYDYSFASQLSRYHNEIVSLVRTVEEEGKARAHRVT